MKKIVGIIAAVAMATSVFAIDVASMLQLDGNLATFGKDKFNAFELNEWDPQGTADFVWKFSVSSDNAGATIFNYSNTAGSVDNAVENENVKEWSLWFKPIDALKVTVGNIAYGSAQPHFGWWAKVIDHPDYGYQFDVNVDALALSFAIGSEYQSGWGDPSLSTYWFDKSRTGFSKIGEFWAAASYDFGDIGKFGFSIDRGAKVNPHGFAQTMCWQKTPLSFDFYYSNQPWGQTGYFADFALVMREKADDADKNVELDRLTGQLYGEIHADAFTLYLIDVLELNFDENAGKEGSTIKKFKDGFEIKAQYAIDAYTPYIQIDGYGIMDKTLGIKTAVGFNVGAVAIDAGANFALNFNDGADKCTVTVPIQFTINL